MIESRVKPIGLSWLGILAVLTGMLLAAGGLSLASGLGTSSAGPELFGIAVSTYVGYIEIGAVTQQWTLLGTILVVLASVYFVAAVGLFKGKKWVWALSIGLSVLGIGSDMFQLAVLGSLGGVEWLPLLIASAILFYLTRPHVRRFFR